MAKHDIMLHNGKNKFLKKKRRTVIFTDFFFGPYSVRSFLGLVSISATISFLAKFKNYTFFKCLP